MLPGIPPTGKRVEVAMVAVVQFDDDKLAHEHLYWAEPQHSCSFGLLATCRACRSQGQRKRDKCSVGAYG
jgi:hypothetical protein